MQKLKSQKKNKILIVAAHPDDEILGCGGTMIKLKNTNDINVVFMTDGISARETNESKKQFRKKRCDDLFKYLKLKKPIFFDFPDNKMDEVPLLDIVKKLEALIKKIKPKTIFTHYADCLNIDHKITSQAVMTACRPLKDNSVKRILSFEILSSTEWAKFKNKGFEPNFFIDISYQFKKKIVAMKFYQKELRKFPHSRSLKAIESLARFRGASSGVNFAEGFYLNRWIE
jgi:LmbE family N-acetylglucosaminyl deacetylase